MYLVDFFIILIICTTKEFVDGSHRPSLLTLGQKGQNVTLHANAVEDSSIAWYRQKLNGELEMICSESYGHFLCDNPRYTMGMLDNSGKKGSLMIFNASGTDSGRYLTALKRKKAELFLGSLYLNLVITDPAVPPIIRLFHGSSYSMAHVFQCEVTGAGAHWTNPYWEKTENGQTQVIEGRGGEDLDAKGHFTRWSVATFQSELAFSLTCMCHHNHTGETVKTKPAIIGLSKGASVCVSIMFLGPLCCLLLLLTVVLAVLSAWRRYQHRQHRPC
ncbi:hypothetical protein ACEWY4_019608 [Coilia grayii]|uniref:Immunoglobulin V-set domain-containing protein n=1 Tax=Coilia grayii TaxID=363190 RepID=A0ABD1JCM9_9TELE